MKKDIREWVVVEAKRMIDVVPKSELQRVQKLLDEAAEREIHLENCVQRLFDLVEKFPLHIKGLNEEAINIYNEAEIVVRDRT